MDTDKGLDGINSQSPVPYSTPPPVPSSSMLPRHGPQEKSAESNTTRHRLNKRGIQIRDKAIQENTNNGKLHDKQFLAQVVSEIQAVGNAYYEVNLLEKQILRSKAKPRVKSTGKKVSEEDTLFPSIDGEKRSVIKWLHLYTQTSNSEMASGLELQHKDLEEYVQYLNEATKKSTSVKHHSLEFKQLFPSISAENKATLRKLLDGRPDASSTMARLWGSRLGIQSAQAAYYVWFLRMSRQVPKLAINSESQDKDAYKPLTPTSHLPTPSLSTSPEPRQPLLLHAQPAQPLGYRFLGDQRSGFYPHPISSTLPQSSHQVSTPEVSPVQTMVVKSEQMPSPAIYNRLLTTESDPGRSTTTTSFSPHFPLEPHSQNVSVLDTSSSDIDMHIADPKSPSLRSHSVPPIARLEILSEPPSSQILPDITSHVEQAPIISQASSGTSEEEDQLADDDDDDKTLGTIGDHVGGCILLETQPLGRNGESGNEGQDESSSNATGPNSIREDHVMEEMRPNLNKSGESSILELFSLGPPPLPEEKKPTTAQELLDKISAYEDDIDWLLAFADSLAAKAK